MQCKGCKTTNDPDALFCVECGKELALTPQEPAKPNRSYYFMFVLVPVIAVVVGLGYYKFFLPDGIAAVVNGEEIRLAELDAVIARSSGNGVAPDAGSRYRALYTMITERLVFQEARKSGITVTSEEVTAAVSQARSASGLDEAAFQREMSKQYGSVQAFRESMEQRLMINRFLDEKVVPRHADAETARTSVDRWMQELSARASVRIALAGEVPGPGCNSGCGKGCGSSKPCQGMQTSGCPQAGSPGCNRAVMRE
jgi:hypothetical protein